MFVRLFAKYNPRRVVENRREYLANVKNRVETFEWFYERSKLDDVPLVATSTDDIVRMMDMAVILVEGGNENDFQALDTEPQELPAATEQAETKNETKKENDKSPKSEGWLYKQINARVKPVYSGHLGVGPNKTVLIVEMSLFQRFIYTHLYCNKIMTTTDCPYYRGVLISVCLR